MSKIKVRRNPYIAGKALTTDSDFFDREEILKKVINTFETSENNQVVLYGQRRIGKTSILFKLVRLLPTPPFFPVYIDLMDKAKKSINDVLFDIATICAEKAGISVPDKDLFDSDPNVFHLIFLPELYKHLGDQQRPVFLFDEFDVLDQYEERLPDNAAAIKFHPYLRQFISTQTNMCFVFVVGRRMQELTFDFLSTFKSAQSIPIFVLDTDHAIELIKRGEQEGLAYDQEAINEILFLTRCHPYFIQLLCQEIYNKHVQQNSFEVINVTKQMVKDSVSSALASGGSAFQWIWKGLPPAERIVFSAIAEKTVPGSVLTDSEIASILRDAGIRMMMKELNLAPSTLLEWKMLEKSDNGYRFQIELMRRWVEQYQPLWQVKDEIEKVNPLADTLFRAADSYYFVQRNPDLALQQLQQALSLNPNHIKARLLQGTIYRDRKDYDNAIKEFKEAFKLDENEARYDLIATMLLQGELFENQEQFDLAEKIYDDILTNIYEHEQTTYDRKIKLLLRKAEQFKKEGDFYSAYRTYLASDASKKAIELVEELALSARQYEAHNDLRQAEKIYSTLISMQPDQSPWQLKQTEIRRQIADQEKVKKLIFEAKNYIESGEINKAEESLKLALKVQPSNQEVLDLKEAVELQITIQSYLENATNKFQLRDFGAAQEQLQKLLRLQPSNENARKLKKQIEIEVETERNLNIAKEEYSKKNFSRAEDLLRRVLSMQPDNAIAGDLLFQVQSQLKIKQEILENFDHAKKAMEFNSYDDAQSFLTKILRLEPGNQEARDMLLKVKVEIEKAQKRELEQLRASKRERLPIASGILIGVISSILTCVVAVIVLVSNPGLTTLFTKTQVPQPQVTSQVVVPTITPTSFTHPQPAATATIQAFVPSSTPESIGLILQSKRFVFVPISTAQLLDGASAPVKVVQENLQLQPGYHVLKQVPLNFENDFQTQDSDHSNYPSQYILPFPIQKPLSLFFLIQADWGMLQYNGKQVGKITVKFESGSSFDYSLILGVNLRDWSRNESSQGVVTTSSPDIVEAWRGIGTDGRPGGMDLLKVSIPEEYQNETISSINLTDTSLETTGSYDPGIHILAVSAEIQDPTPAAWEYQVEQIPYSNNSLTWQLNSGDVFILTGGTLNYKDFNCMGNGSQICVLVVKATKSGSIKIDNLVPRNNWIATSKTYSPEEAINSVQNEFWLAPNCVSGCSKAKIAIYTDENQVKTYEISNPN